MADVERQPKLLRVPEPAPQRPVVRQPLDEHSGLGFEGDPDAGTRRMLEDAAAAVDEEGPRACVRLVGGHDARPHRHDGGAELDGDVEGAAQQLDPLLPTLRNETWEVLAARVEQET